MTIRQQTNIASLQRSLGCLLSVCFVGCQQLSNDTLEHREALEAFSAAFVSACPSAPEDDEQARDECASALGDSRALRDLMNPSILWGGHNPETHPNYSPSTHHLTRFSAFVFRRIYMSTFSVRPNVTMEKEGDLEILHIPVVFRNRLSPGSYPYPFWHARAKWTAYQEASELIFVFREGKVIAIYRAGKELTAPDRDPGTFDGQWRWFDESGEEQPKVALFSYLLSKDNPHLSELDSAFRALESEARDQACLTCHVPDNISQMDQLVLLNYPNQALGSRHELLKVFEENTMPPASGLDAQALQEIASLARTFAEIGDRALMYEAQE